MAKKISPVRDAYGASTRSRLSLRLKYYIYFSRKDGSRQFLPAFFSGPRIYPDFIRIFERAELAVLGPIFIKTEVKFYENG